MLRQLAQRPAQQNAHLTHPLPCASPIHPPPSGRTGRAGKTGTAIAMFQPKEIGYFKRILRETETGGVKMISVPSPREVIEAAAKQVCVCVCVPFWGAWTAAVQGW